MTQEANQQPSSTIETIDMVNKLIRENSPLRKDLVEKYRKIIAKVKIDFATPKPGKVSTLFSPYFGPGGIFYMQELKYIQKNEKNEFTFSTGTDG